MLIPLLLYVANFLGKLLDGVLEGAVLHLKIWSYASTMAVLRLKEGAGRCSPCCFLAAAEFAAMAIGVCLRKTPTAQILVCGCNLILSDAK
jgi:hypothetical protein